MLESTSNTALMLALFTKAAVSGICQQICGSPTFAAWQLGHMTHDFMPGMLSLPAVNLSICICSDVLCCCRCPSLEDCHTGDVVAA